VIPTRRLSKRVYGLLALILGFSAGLLILIGSLVLHGAAWAGNRANAHAFSGGALSAAGGVYDRNGLALAASLDGERILPESKAMRMATLHAVGDPEGFISSGAQSVFRNTLIGWSRWNGMYSLVRYGRGSDVLLSLDANLCEAAYKALDGKKGTVGVMNYKTGELLCMVSSPSFDPLKKPTDIEDNEKYDAVYLNRLFHGLFTPGSTFKIITMACAIENIPDLDSRIFTCTGKYATGEGYVICNNTHGKVNFQQAVNKSCNSTFAQLAIELGEDKLRATAEAMGFNQNYVIDGIPISTSRFATGQLNALELGWAGVGQHTTLANPAHMLMLMSAIANGGEGYLPRFALATRSPAGYVSAFGGGKPKVGIKLNAATANQLQILLRSNVTDQYSPGGAHERLRLCGKTGTAEVDGKTPHSWFVGFSLAEETPYAIVVLGENAGGGRAVAYEIALKVLETMG
jgi:peptidoglycan glycosyltransferase